MFGSVNLNITTSFNFLSFKIEPLRITKLSLTLLEQYEPISHLVSPLSHFLKLVEQINSKEQSVLSKSAFFIGNLILWKICPNGSEIFCHGYQSIKKIYKLSVLISERNWKKIGKNSIHLAYHTSFLLSPLLGRQAVFIQMVSKMALAPFGG
ncbi:MAG: hypothetical protein L0207_05220 [Chlamydiae bacterium]|nr:hypothetical protein [Chlamydiota bacterium]